MWRIMKKKQEKGQVIAMQLDEFKLEVYFDKYEFTAPHLLCQSDCEAMSIEELLALEPGAREAFLKSWLGYTRAQGSPELRGEIAKLYGHVDEEGILVHVGAQEAIFNFMNTMLNPGDHVIVMTPAYQSLFEVARAIGCQISKWELEQGSEGWTLDLARLKKLVQPNTKVIVVNSPNNPTGYTLSAEEMAEIAALARQRGIYVFCDEVYKGLELDGKKRGWFADLYEDAVSLGVMSKSYGLAGLRIGWIATQNKEIYGKMARFKHYTTICSSGPAEFLSTVALRHGKELLDRNYAIIADNLQAAKEFFASYSDLFVNNEPMAGPVAFHRLKIDRPVADFCHDLVSKKGVLLLPADMYLFPGNYFRMGYGRKDFKRSLAVMAEYCRENRAALK